MNCVRGCTLRARHLDDCPDQDTCWGCLPRMAARGRLCEPCYKRLEEALRQLPLMWHELAEWLYPERRGTQVRVSGTPEPQLEIDLFVAGHRQRIVQLLASWSMQISEERQVTPPTSTRVVVMCQWLLRNLEWAAAAYFIGDFYDEVRGRSGRLPDDETPGLHRQARGILNSSGVKRKKVGACIEAGCPGTVTAETAPAEVLEFPSALVCDADETHTWPPNQWHAFGRAVHRRTA